MAILPSAIYVPTYLAMKRYQALPAQPSSSIGLAICAARIPYSRSMPRFHLSSPCVQDRGPKRGLARG